MMTLDDDGTGKLKLHGEATIHTASDLQAALVTAKAKGSTSFELDLSDLTELDTAGAQLLVAFKRSRLPVTIHSCPNGLRDFLRNVGLEPWLF